MLVEELWGCSAAQPGHGQEQSLAGQTVPKARAAEEPAFPRCSETGIWDYALEQDGTPALSVSDPLAVRRED